MTGRPRRWWLLIPLAFVLAQVPFLLQPIQGLHKWRQADTAAVARNLAQESFDPLRPRVDIRGELSGITGMECPLYQTIVATGIVAAGDHDIIGKLVALAAAMAAWLALAALLVRRLGVSPWAAHAALASSPLLFLYAAKVMPETSALLLAVVSLERLDAHRASGRLRELACSAGLLAAAALIRPYVVFAGLPLALCWFAELREHRAGWRYLVAGILAAAPFLLWYFLWSPHLVRAYGLAYFFTGYPLRDNLAKMTGSGLWIGLFNSTAQHLVGWITLPLAAWGGWLLVRRERERLIPAGTTLAVAGIALCALIGIPLLVGGHTDPHHYYLLALVIPVAACLAVGFEALLARWPRAGLAACIAPVLLVPLLLAHAYRTDRHSLWYAGLTAEVTTATAPGDLFLIEDRGSGAWHLHPLRRRGWVENRARLEDPAHIASLIAKGLRWVVSFEVDRYRLSTATDWLARLTLRNSGDGKRTPP